MQRQTHLSLPQDDHQPRPKQPSRPTAQRADWSPASAKGAEPNRNRTHGPVAGPVSIARPNKWPPQLSGPLLAPAASHAPAEPTTSGTCWGRQPWCETPSRLTATRAGPSRRSRLVPPGPSAACRRQRPMLPRRFANHRAPWASAPSRSRSAARPSPGRRRAVPPLHAAAAP
jgi:hypothetical protein